MNNNDDDNDIQGAENSKFKPAVPNIKTDLVSHSTRYGVLRKYTLIDTNSHEFYIITTYQF